MTEHVGCTTINRMMLSTLRIFSLLTASQLLVACGDGESALNSAWNECHPNHIMAIDAGTNFSMEMISEDVPDAAILVEFKVGPMELFAGQHVVPQTVSWSRT